MALESASMLKGRTADTKLSQLTDDLDGCTVSFSPNGITRWKLGPNCLVVESRLPHTFSLVRTRIQMPGAESKWKLSQTGLNEVLLEDRVAGQRVRFKVVGLNRVLFELHFATRPSGDSIGFPVTFADSALLAVDSAGNLTFTMDRDCYLMLEPWVAKDSAGKNLGVSWRVDREQRVFVDLAKADWDNAKYPVVVA